MFFILSFVTFFLGIYYNYRVNKKLKGDEMLTYKKEVYQIEFVIENDSQVEVTKFEKLDDNLELNKKDIEELIDYGEIEYDLTQDSIAINANDLQ